MVLDAPFTKELKNPAWPDELRAKLNCAVEIHYLCCSPEKRRERMIKRAAKRDQGKLENWEDYLKYYGDEALPACQHLAISTSELTDQIQPLE